ncbi:hypothetical protein MKK63_22645 [Methylobacterium sp. J-088]|uniref:hypothetical protein n=1 Tax=Methylobacterium sp. J-088 TaxID=2836664 RepID=UPI001FBB5094|nr:hypothetical protein [Methylobacterium sp. J-088]MCJ2065488.1 hypothetical protein [Methylobacterium sp. J-088]
MMMAPRLLSQTEFSACFTAPMRNVTATAEAVVDVWSYTESIALPLGPVTELLDVTDVYRDAADRFDQVLIGTNVDNLLLVVIVDNLRHIVHGHYFLDLVDAYGLTRT